MKKYEKNMKKMIQADSARINTGFKHNLHYPNIEECHSSHSYKSKYKDYS